jgi:hypothetical protein
MPTTTALEMLFCGLATATGMDAAALRKLSLLELVTLATETQTELTMANQNWHEAFVTGLSQTSGLDAADLRKLSLQEMIITAGNADAVGGSVPELTINVSLVDGLRVIRIPEVDADPTAIGALVAFGGDSILDESGKVSDAAVVYVPGVDNPVLESGDISALGFALATGESTGTGAVKCLTPEYNAGETVLIPEPESDDYDEPLARVAFDVSDDLPGVQFVACWGATPAAVDVGGVLNVAGGWFPVNVTDGLALVPVYPENDGETLNVACRKHGCTPSDLDSRTVNVDWPDVEFSDHEDNTVDATPSDLDFAVATWKDSDGYVAPALPLVPGVANASASGTNINACIVLRRDDYVLRGPTTGPTQITGTYPTVSIPDTGDDGLAEKTNSEPAEYSLNSGTNTEYTVAVSVAAGDAIKMRGTDGILKSSWNEQTYTPVVPTPEYVGSGKVGVIGVESVVLTVQEKDGDEQDVGEPFNPATTNNQGNTETTAALSLTDGTHFHIVGNKANFTESAMFEYTPS